jgi:hypothetical protein
VKLRPRFSFSLHQTLKHASGAYRDSRVSNSAGIMVARLHYGGVYHVDHHVMWQQPARGFLDTPIIDPPFDCYAGWIALGRRCQVLGAWQEVIHASWTSAMTGLDLGGQQQVAMLARGLLLLRHAVHQCGARSSNIASLGASDCKLWCASGGLCRTFAEAQTGPDPGKCCAYIVRCDSTLGLHGQPHLA